MCEQGIVISLIKYGDEDEIVSVFFGKEGMVSFLVRRLRGKSSNRMKAVLQPLNIVEVDYDLRKNKQLQRLKDVATSDVQQLADDSMAIIKSTIKMFLAEVLRAVLKHEKENQELFDFIVYSMRWLNNATTGIGNFHLVFLSHLLKFLGYNPVYDADFNELRKFQDCDYDTMAQHQMNHTDRTDKLEHLLYYYRMHIPEFPEIKSLEILKTIG